MKHLLTTILSVLLLFIKKIDVKYGDYGIATEDEVKTNTHAENDIKLGINVAF